MNRSRKIEVLDSFIISVVLTAVMTVVMTAVNVGFNDRYWGAFLFSFVIGVVVSFPTSLLVIPPITRWVTNRIGEVEQPPDTQRPLG